jgi:Zn-dependent protease
MNVNGNVTLGRLGGVEVRLNWSWLVILALLVWTLSDGVFPAQDPGLSHGTYLAMGVVAAVLFLVSVLLHELGHAWIARREGVEIDGITLWLFGGVTQFKSRFVSAGSEFRIAIAGPLVSIAIGVISILVAQAGLPSAVDGVAAWLGYINLTLAVFNLIPALPLDGGRVFRALLWRVKGDLGWATRVASDVGQGFGYLFVALGVAMLIFQGSFSGAWLVFVGWFVLQAARAEARYIAAEEALDGLRVRDLMVRRPVSVDADATIGRFMDEVAWSHRFTTYPVVAEGRPIGLLAFASMARVPRAEWDRRCVRDAMIPLDEVPQLGEDAKASPRAHRAVDGHGAVVGRDVQVVRIDLGVPLERLLDRLLRVAGVRRRAIELDLVDDVERTDDVRGDVLRLVTLVLPVGGAGEGDEAVLHLCVHGRRYEAVEHERLEHVAAKLGVRALLVVHQLHLQLVVDRGHAEHPLRGLPRLALLAQAPDGPARVILPPSAETATATLSTLGSQKSSSLTSAISSLSRTFASSFRWVIGHVQRSDGRLSAASASAPAIARRT